MDIAHTPFASPDGALDAASCWQDAVDKIAEYFTSVGRCYSSGEISRPIREKRPDLIFRVGWVGDRLRNAFVDGSLKAWADPETGLPVGPARTERLTTGASRTPPGTAVFVYGPDEDTCFSHDFETDIPLPVSTDGSGAQEPIPTGAAPNAPVVANGRLVPGNAVAVVHADGRLCIPRLAFEALAFASGRPVIGGLPLHVEISGTSITVMRDASTTSSEACPTSDHLRLHLTVPGLTVGTRYVTEVTRIAGDDHLKIDLAASRSPDIE